MRCKVGVVIPVFNESEYIERSLESLVRQKVDKDVFKVVVVDNNCTDNTVDKAKELLDKGEMVCELASESRQGIEFARWRGFEVVADCTYLVTLDAEVVLPDGFVAGMIARFESTGAEALWYRAVLPWELMVGMPAEMRRGWFAYMSESERLAKKVGGWLGPGFEGFCYAVRSDEYRRVGGVSLSEAGPIRYQDDLGLARKIYYGGGLIVDGRESIEVSGRRIYEDIEGYLTGESHWGDGVLSKGRRFLNKIQVFCEDDFDRLRNRMLRVRGEVVLRYYLDALIYLEQNAKSRRAERVVQNVEKVVGIERRKSVSVGGWRKDYDCLKRGYLSEVCALLGEGGKDAKK